MYTCSIRLSRRLDVAFAAFLRPTRHLKASECRNPLYLSWGAPHSYHLFGDPGK